MKQTLNEAKSCYHCGEDVIEKGHVKDNHDFCCTGCLSVYTLLQESGMDDYYGLEAFPGKKNESKQLSYKYDYLENSEIAHALLDFYSESLNRVTLRIPAIHCSSCIWLLENLNRLHNGVLNVRVNFPKKEAAISYNPKEISLKELALLLDKINYVPEFIKAQKSGKTEIDAVQKQLLLRLGVAGFSFGNVMLLSFPEYVSGITGVEQHYESLFGILSFGLSIPVLLYSATEYLKSAYKGFINKYLNIDIPISLGILALFFWSTFEVFSQTGAGYFDSFTGLLFFLLIGKWFQNKTYRALTFDRDFESFFPIGVTKVTSLNTNEIVPLKSIQVNDELLIRNEELIPVDSLLYTGKAYIDYSFVTGESAPVRVQRGDKIFAGGIQKGASITIKALTTVSQSYLTGLWHEQNREKQHDSARKTLIDKVSEKFTIGVLVISLVAAIAWYFINPAVILQVTISILIVACPCALALSFPFTFGNAMRILGKHGLYIKSNAVVEELAAIDTIVFDKTGTLTTSKNNTVNENFIHELTNEQRQIIKSIVSQSTHPLSQIIDYYIQLEPVAVSNFEEVKGKGLQATVHEQLVRIGSEEFVGNSPLGGPKTAAEVHIGINGEYLGYFSIKKQYRTGLEQLIKNELNQYKLHLISGDHSAEESYLSNLFPSGTTLKFNQKPSDKSAYINALKSKHSNVLMVGDGLNDAAALKASNVGLAVADDVHGFSPASDTILDAKKFTSLGKMLAYSKESIKILNRSLIVSLTYNSIGLVFALTGNLSPIVAAILMPLSSITIVTFVTISTNLSAKKVFGNH